MESLVEVLGCPVGSGLLDVDGICIVEVIWMEGKVVYHDFRFKSEYDVLVIWQ